MALKPRLTRMSYSEGVGSGMPWKPPLMEVCEKYMGGESEAPGPHYGSTAPGRASERVLPPQWLLSHTSRIRRRRRHGVPGWH